ncbi:DUF397 domain-containing protein [Streptomyces sp. NPDC058471]|uniref:DUF397 domain-containing protein n=1 Tax=Streptomyces sp. NPDC058471 TaxID=3346516 RepID=UPI00364AEEC9
MDRGGGERCGERAAHCFRGDAALQPGRGGRCENDCVEIATTLATTPATIHLRDSKNPQGPRLAFAPAAWGDFVTYTSGS